MIYCSTDITSEKINIDDIDNLEILAIKIKTGNSCTHFVAIYRPPTQTPDLDKLFYSKLQDLVKSEFILLGDFNVPEFAQNERYTSPASQLANFIEDNFLIQNVDKPTRGNNILDLVFSSHENLVYNVKIEDALANSDHKTVTFYLNIKTETTKNIKCVPDFRKAKFSEYKNELNKVDWDSVFSDCSDIDRKWSALKDKMKSIRNVYVPSRSKRDNKNNPGWFNEGIRSTIIQRDKAHAVYSRNPNSNNKENFFIAKRKVKSIVKSSKRNYEKSIADNCKKDPKRFYSYVSSNKKVKDTIGPLVDDSGQIVSDFKSMASILNNYFGSVFEKENEYNIPVIPNLREFNDNEKLSNITLTDGDIDFFIDKLNSNKAPGPDELYSRELKELKEVIRYPIKTILMESLETGVVPNDFKIANVTPIFKKGDKTIPANYRPISLTSLVGKLLESVLKVKITNHLNKYDLISDKQHGFRKNRSCLTNLLQFYDKVINDYDEDRETDIIYLDFQKAFDKVPHKRLVKKLAAHGIVGKVAFWIENWLKNRKQRVVINGEISEFIDVTSGVPQGSVLGPLLFIIYVNDIHVNVQTNIALFADDTKIGGKSNTPENRFLIQNDLEKIYEWSILWEMKFNLNKCKTLHVGAANNKHSYTMGNHVINDVTSEKDLGVFVSSDLKNKMQCIDAAKRANRVLGFISRNFDYKSSDIILPLYKSMVRPHLEYCVQFWNPYLRGDIDVLERVQRRATKLIPSLRNKPYLERLRALNLPTLETRRLRGNLIETFKIIKGFENVNSAYFFEFDNGITRNNGFKLNGKRFCTNISKFYFTNRVVEVWNGLPKEVVDAKSINSFKNRLDKEFKRRAIW